MPRTSNNPLEMALARDLSLSGELTQADLVNASGFSQQKIAYWTRGLPDTAREVYFSRKWAEWAGRCAHVDLALAMLRTGVARLDDLPAELRGHARGVDWRTAREAFCLQLWTVRLREKRQAIEQERAAIAADAWKYRIAFRDGDRMVVYAGQPEEWERINAGRTEADYARSRNRDR